MRFRLIPRDEGFFPLFDQQAQIAADTAKVFQQLISSLPLSSMQAEQVVTAEKKADGVLRNVRTRLEEAIVTPFDREDIQSLANALDDVLDEMRAAADNAFQHSIATPLPGIDDLLRILCEITAKNVTLVHGLRTLRDLNDLIDEIERLEDAGDLGEVAAHHREPREAMRADRGERDLARILFEQALHGESTASESRNGISRDAEGGEASWNSAIGAELIERSEAVMAVDGGVGAAPGGVVLILAWGRFGDEGHQKDAALQAADEAAGRARTEKLRADGLQQKLDDAEKERVLAALKRSGETVGFLGDGINDASALHAADVDRSTHVMAL